MVLYRYIEVPPVPAEAALHGLFTAAPPVAANLDEEGGIAWRNYGCAQPSYWAPACLPNGNPDTKTVSDRTGTSEQAPVILYVATECDTVGMGVGDDERQRTLDLLELGTQSGVEQALWGTAEDSPMQGDEHRTLVRMIAETSSPAASGGHVLSSGSTPMDRKSALAALSGALAGCAGGQRGVIHAPAYLGELWAQELLVEDGQRLRTKGRGDTVVVGSGYPGTGPVGHAAATPPAGAQWAFATGPLIVRLGDVQDMTGGAAGAVNRETNDQTWYAERTAVWQLEACCVYAALVSVAT